MAITPTNNWSGHGFYQLSPQLYFDLLPAAGFEPQCMLVRSVNPGARWYRVADPASVKRRVPQRGVWPSLLYVLARRVTDRALEDVLPQQSDYEAAWAVGGITRVGIRRFRDLVPRRARRPLREVLNMTWSLRRFPALAQDFRPVRLPDLSGPLGPGDPQSGR